MSSDQQAAIRKEVTQQTQSLAASNEIDKSTTQVDAPSAQDRDWTADDLEFIRDDVLHKSKAGSVQPNSFVRALTSHCKHSLAGLPFRNIQVDKKRGYVLFDTDTLQDCDPKKATG